MNDRKYTPSEFMNSLDTAIMKLRSEYEANLELDVELRKRCIDFSELINQYINKELDVIQDNQWDSETGFLPELKEELDKYNQVKKQWEFKHMARSIIEYQELVAELNEISTFKPTIPNYQFQIHQPTSQEIFAEIQQKMYEIREKSKGMHENRPKD